MRKWVTRMREKHVDDVSRTHTYIHTYIQKYSDFLVYTISVGLAQARPNYRLRNWDWKLVTWPIYTYVHSVL